MTTERPKALRLASDIAASGQFTNPFTLDAAAAELRTQHARITALESQLAQRFDAADMATAAQQGAYAALPEYGINTASHAHFRVLGFTADQMRAFADATCALRASRGQAPASVLHLVNSAFAEIAMAFPKAFALHKVGIADKAVLEALAAPATAQADSVLEDAARYRFLRDGEWRDTDLEPFIRLQLNTLWDAKIDAARKQGATHD